MPLLPLVGSGGSPGNDVLPGLRSVSARSGLVFDGESGLPEWFGEPLTRDGLQWVVAGLLQLDRDAAGSGLVEVKQRRDPRPRS